MGHPVHRSYRAHVAKADELATKTQQPHIVWWHQKTRRFRVSSAEAVERLVRAGQFGGKSRIWRLIAPSPKED